jgi:acetylornithine deacetylase
VTEVADLTAALVRIDSVNPSLVPDAAGEGEIARFVAGWLDDAGLEVETVERDGRPSVIGTARGRGGGRSLLLNAHLDTVGVDTMERPFDAYIADGKLYGRGSYDMKGALAAALLATRDAAALGLAGDVVVTAVADEELGSVGTESVLERVRADAASVCEPTELLVAVAHRGFAGFEIETHGVAAHGSMPHLGVDAIDKMGPILVALGALNERLAAGTSHPLLGTASLHASLIEGGQEMSTYPARCLLTGERRTLPGETDADIEGELREVAGDADVRLLVSRGPFAIDEGHELALTLLEVTGEGAVVGLPFWTDAGLTGAAGIPTVLFGPAGEGAHAAEEWVDIGSLERCREVYVAAARALCG